MNKNKLVLVIGILLILGVGIFIFFQKKSLPPVSPEVKKAQQEFMSSCKFDIDFCKYMVNGVAAMTGGYTMTNESRYYGKVSNMTIKTDGKGNSESTTYIDGKETGRYISLNKITYTKGPGETVWTEFPPTKDEAGNQMTNLFDFEGLKKQLRDTADTLVVKKIGTEACGKLTCFVFEMTEKTTDSTTKIWVDTKEYLARKGETKTKEGTGLLVFEYGPVTIIKPSPVEKMPAFDSAPKNTEVNVNTEELNNLMKNIPQTTPQESAPVEETPAE